MITKLSDLIAGLSAIRDEYGDQPVALIGPENDHFDIAVVSYNLTQKHVYIEAVQAEGYGTFGVRR